MALISPVYQVDAALRALAKSGRLAQLSPQAQAAIIAATKQPSGQIDMNDQGLQAALSEAVQADALPGFNHDSLLRNLTNAGVKIGAFLIGAKALNSLSGSSAPSPSTTNTDPNFQGPQQPVTPPPSTPNPWKSLAPTLVTEGIKAGTDLASAKIQTNANDKAAQITADQADRALAQAKAIYDQNRSDLEPYRQEGVSSLALLNSHLGLPAPTQTQSPAPPSSTLASLGPQQNTQAEPMVNMLSPSGQPGQVPQSKVQQALAAGGKLA